MKKGIIELEEMEFYAYHGCFSEENRVGNHYSVNISITTDIDEAMKTDDINKALNYVTVYNLVEKEMSVVSNLVEHVAGRICDAIFKNFNYVDNIKVKVSKLNPPIGGVMKAISVTVER